MKKKSLLKAFSFALVLMACNVANAKVTTIYTGPNDDGGWVDILWANAGDYTVNDGDMFRVTVSALGNNKDGWYQILIRDRQNPEVYVDGTSEAYSISAAGTYYITIADGHAASINSTGFSIISRYAIISKVELITKDEPSTELYNETQVFTSYYGLQFDKSIFNSISAGDMISMNITAFEKSDAKFSFKQKDNGWDELTGFGWVDVSSAYTYYYTVTETAATELATYGLVIQGNNITIDNVTVIKTLSLDDSYIMHYEAGNYAGIKQTRTYKEGWNTVCVPFATTAAALTGDEDAVAYTLGDGCDNTKLTLTSISDMAANTPYFVKCTKECVNPVVYGLTAVATPSALSSSKQGGWTLIGNYTPDFSIADNWGLSDNIIYQGDSDAKINGMRAYLTYNGANPVKKVNIEVFDGTTGISTVVNKATVKSYYTLQGIRVNEPSHGLYIMNGKKVLLK